MDISSWEKVTLLTPWSSRVVYHHFTTHTPLYLFIMADISSYIRPGVFTLASICNLWASSEWHKTNWKSRPQVLQENSVFILAVTLTALVISQSSWRSTRLRSTKDSPSTGIGGKFSFCGWCIDLTGWQSKTLKEARACRLLNVFPICVRVASITKHQMEWIAWPRLKGFSHWLINAINWLVIWLNVNYWENKYPLRVFTAASWSKNFIAISERTAIIQLTCSYCT